MTKVKVIFLEHSGVAVKLKDNLFVFDYMQGLPYIKQEINNNKIVFIFVSHSHSDHFNPDIFTWEKYNKNISYILSSDLIKEEKNNYYYLQQDEELIINNILIKTLASTDKGVSFLVKIKDIAIFHAGDLNCWYWKHFSKEKQLKELKDYTKIIEKLVGEKIDLAFIPVDPRLEEYYYLAAKLFAEKIRPKVIIPIHLWQEYSITKNLREKLIDSKVKIIQIEKKGEEFSFNF